MATPRGHGWKQVAPGHHVSTDGQYSIVKGTNWEGKTTWWATHHDPVSGQNRNINGWNNLPATKSLVSRHRDQVAREAQQRVERTPPNPAELQAGIERLSRDLGQRIFGGLYNDRRSN